MVRPKVRSKRQPVRLRHKIEKRGNEKKRKERRHEKKHPELYHKKKPAVLNIPNSFPYKDRLLAEIEEGRRLRKEEQEKRKEDARQRRKELASSVDGGEDAMYDVDAISDSASGDEGSDTMDTDEEQNGSNSAMAALLASARARAIKYEGEHGDSSNSDMDDNYKVGWGQETLTSKETSRKQFDKLFKQLVDTADVILYVLDARDPDGTRSREVERQIMAAAGGEKRLILVLNKIDLIPSHVLKAWLVYLRRYFPTLPLKACNSAPNSQAFDHKSLTVQGTSTALLKALKSFAHSKQLKRSVTVGVIGYPNVGKSSVINTLMGRHGGSQSASCPTGAGAGVTTSLREVKLDKKLKLLDSPGIVFPNEHDAKGSKSTAEQARLILLNVIPPKQIEDPVPAVTLLLQRMSTSPTLFQRLLDVYNIPPIVNTSMADLTKNFLIEVARKRGRFGRGGVPNIESAAMAVIMDWRAGRIQGWIDPPRTVASNAAMQQGIKGEIQQIEPDQKEIVAEWMEEFKLDGLLGDVGACENESTEVEMQG